MRKAIFSIVTIFALLIGVSYAYADHPLTHGYDEHKCFSFYMPSTNTYTTNCSWSYTPNEMEKALIENGTISEPEPEIVEEIIEEVVEPKRLDTSDPKQAMEFYIDRLEEKAKVMELSTADEELLKMLASVHEICYLGIEEGRLIQKFAQFIIPTYEPDVETELSNKWLLNQLFKKQQECAGWDIYKEKWLGQQYLDIEDVNIKRAEIIREELHAKYPSDFTDPVTQRDLDDENDRSHSMICRSTLWGEQFKKDQGCLTAEVSLVGGSVSFSKQGQAIMSKWQAYLDTGAAEIPDQTIDTKLPITPIDIIKNYMRAYNVTASDLED